MNQALDANCWRSRSKDCLVQNLYQSSEDAKFRGYVASDSEVLQSLDCRHRHARSRHRTQASS
ncbi:hypothetical protein L195_g064011 [Trifolium pratense]|uniref:Uncharacterized protein n=1 Tax=Trifolium pratense TaxID=57577 RepID=A0A2K3KQE1_TRIPR|nr:hypothetical protein L195_g064011 [Trifolium pratense]